MSKPRELSKILTSSTSIATDEELFSTVNSASAYALSEANDYTDSAIANFEALPSQSGNAGKYLSTSGSVTSWEELDLNAAINTASAAAVNFLVDGAPGALDTLNELAAALDDNADILDLYLTQSSASSIYSTQESVSNLYSDLEIIPLDDLQPLFDGKESRFLPTYQSASVAITNPLKLMISINGIIQSVDFPETVWQSMMPRRGFRIDNEGYIAFAEPVPIGATCDARILAGPSTTTRTRIYPFKAIDISLGG